MTVPVVPPRRPVRPLTPWPMNDAGKRTDELDLSVKIEGPTGWFDLEDGLHYAIHGDSFGEYQQTWRQRTVNNEWVEGTYPVTAVRENVNEPLIVWVKAEDHGTLEFYKSKLIAAIEQISYMVMVRRERIVEYWTCFPADYSVQTQREYQHNHLAVVRANVPRLPTKQFADASLDEF